MNESRKLLLLNCGKEKNIRVLKNFTFVIVFIIFKEI